VAKNKSSSKKSSKSRKSAPGKTAKKTAKKARGKAKSAKARSSSGKGRKKSSAKRSRKPKSPLTKAQLKEFRGMLLEKRRELIGDMTGIEADALGKFRDSDTSEALSMPTHPADVGSDNYEQEFTLGLLESERILLSEINEALERIDDGTFGICLGTGEPIGEPRLRARPWSKYCIDYQRKIEQGLVHPDEDEYDFDQDDEDDDEDDEDLDIDDEDEQQDPDDPPDEDENDEDDEDDEDY
jgi:RNA polymerase-binding protein DksA